MKAIVQDTYGPAEVLELRNREPPQIGHSEVLVQVVAAGVDRATWHRMTGVPYLMRVIGFGFRAPKVPVAGTNVAGVVESVGKDVTRFQPGDEVYGIGKGAFAELTAAPEQKVAPKPSRLSFEEAAVMPHGGLTALQAVRDQGKVREDDEVLVIGASGAVGSMAVQIAKASGAEVTGVCSTAKVEMVRSLGAAHVIDYTTEDFTEGSRRYDVIIDNGGDTPLSRLRRVLTPKGTLVIVGSEGGGRWLGIGRQIRATLLSPFVGQKLVMLMTAETAEDLLALNELIDAGKLTPVIDRTFPLAEAPDAIRYFESGAARGRIAVTI